MNRWLIIVLSARINYMEVIVMTEKQLIIPPTIPLKKNRWGELSVESARDVLNELVELGYGDFELRIGYDSNLVYTGFKEKIYVDEKRKTVEVME
jgi:hypothetical protein